MIYVELPLYSDSEMYRYSTTIEDDAKQLTFRWNSRTKSWHMDIQNEDQTEVISGVALVPLFPILADHSLIDWGISGYFLLLPVNTERIPDLSTQSSSMAEFFKFFYVYAE